MKKIVLVGLMVLLFVGCGTLNTHNNKADIDGFIENHDDLTGDTFIVHKDLQKGFLYNLKDSITGERENLSLLILNKKIFAIRADYQYSKWLFIEKIVLVNENNERLIISDGRNSQDIVNGNVLREGYSAILNSDQVSILKKIIASKSVYCAFVGSKGRTDKLLINEKQKRAVLLTINKFEQFKNLE